MKIFNKSNTKNTGNLPTGDTVDITSNKKHGIKNMGNDVLEYLRANSPMFEEQYESNL